MRLLPLLAALLLGVGCSAPEPPPPPRDADTNERVRQLAAILDYVAADYAMAVRDGEVVNELEYAEQQTFLADATALARTLPGDAPGAGQLAHELATLRASVTARAAPGEVASAARGTRSSLLERYGVVLGPGAPPSRERGRALWAEHCTSCHGATGAGDGPLAAALDPPPTSFLDPAIMADLTPARAFSALTDGLDGTAMTSFGHLSPSDRWSLAFHVVALRHDPGESGDGDARLESGAAAYERAGRPVAATATRLAGASDAQLDGALAAAGLDASERADALAFLRARAPYRRTGAPFDATREALGAALAAYRSGERSAAARQLGAAYLDGFEPHEAALAAHDAELVVGIESAFLDARGAIAAGAPADAVEQRVLRVGALLDRAEERIASRGGARVAFAGSFLILLREGIEGALLILLLLGWANEVGAGARDTRAVHGGWIAALALGGVTWIAAGSLIAWLGGARRELIEGAVSLAAAGVLLFASHFVLARLDARRRVAALRRRLDAAVSPLGRRWALGALAFAAVYREAFEVVLFLQALLLDTSGAGRAVAAGALAALAALAIVVVLARRVERRLSPARLLGATGLLLCALAFTLTGGGVRSLQEAGLVGIHPLGRVRIDWLGVYPTAETLGAQALALLAFLLIAGVAWLRPRGALADAAAERTAASPG